MPRTYELGFIVEPRQSDDDVKTIATKYRQMIEASGATITEEDHWGKRKLAYPIHKFTEGYYVFLFVSTDGPAPWPDVERLLMQDEKILRHLIVRTDLDLKRAASKGKKKSPRIQPGQDEAEATA